MLPEHTIVSPLTGNDVGTIFTVLTVAIAQVLGGVHPETLNEIVPVGPAPQITVAESLLVEGTGENTPPVTDQLYVVQFALVRYVTVSPGHTTDMQVISGPELGATITVSEVSYLFQQAS